MTGGTNVKIDIETLKTKNVAVIVGTPGRVFDIISKGVLDTK